MTVAQAAAYPRKRFFLQMFTRDISLEDCLLDLIDNAVDSYLRHAGWDVIAALLTKKQPPASARKGEIRVSLSTNTISVWDNCGGISTKDALEDVFCFGHSDDHKAGRLGVYGIGLKRAIFKIGNKFTMNSKTHQSSFEVMLNVDNWAKRDATIDDWRIPVQTSSTSKDLREPGTHVRFDELREDVKLRLRDTSLEVSIEKSIAQTYAFFLNNGLVIKLNGRVVKPSLVALGESAELRSGNKDFTVDDVKIRLIAGLIAPRSDWTQERAGWYVLCNGRVVLSADKSELTGWGGNRMSEFHPKFRGFVGFALLTSSNAFSLPWTTTKRGLNRESKVYQQALREMVAISRPVLNFLSDMYKSEPEASIVEREAAEAVRPVALSAVASRSATLFETRLKKPPRDTVRVQFDARRSELEQVRKHERQPDLSANKIGRMALDFFLEVECSE